MESSDNADDRNADGGEEQDLLPIHNCQVTSSPRTMRPGWSPGGFGPVVEVEQAVDDDRHEELGEEIGMPVAVRHHRR